MFLSTSLRDRRMECTCAGLALARLALARLPLGGVNRESTHRPRSTRGLPASFCAAPPTAPLPGTTGCLTELGEAPCEHVSVGQVANLLAKLPHNRLDGGRVSLYHN